MKTNVRFICGAILLFAMLASPGAYSQEWKLRLAGEVRRPMSLTQSEFASYPRTSLVTTDHRGKETQYEGVTLYYLLDRAGAPLGDSLHGRNMLLYLQAEGLDGYKAVYALAEMDTLFSNRLILVADKKNGAALDEKEGPLHIVVPGEKEPARWVRQLKSLTVLRSN
jgi:DMSO/TMAO reductase YedYZ molybdopterin-dependent catalytic subunit